MNVSLTPQLEAFVRRKVAGGLYGNVSEVMREALRLLAARDAEAEGAPAIALERTLDRLAALEPALRARGVAGVLVYGSVARGEASAESDVDLLIESAAGVRLSLVDLAGLQDFLTTRLGRPVDVTLADGLDPAIRGSALAEAARAF